MAYPSIKELINSGGRHEDVKLAYNNRLVVLNSLLDVVGCVLSVARQDDEISQADVLIHPASEILGGKPDKLLESTTNVIAWVQEVMFDDRKDYDVMAESEKADEENTAKKGGNGHDGK